MTGIPAIYLDLLLEKKALAHLATVMPDGSPQNTPVWFDYIDGKVRVNSALGRTKVRNMKLGAKVALSIVDPGNPFDPWTAPRRIDQSDRGGGAGIDIVTAWAHFLGYQSKDGLNRLQFLLPLHWRG